MIDKEILETMYADMSIDEMARKLNVARSTLYYHMRKHSIPLRSKSEAQKLHLKIKPHQRVGCQHSEQSRTQISKGAQSFWDSEEGQKQRSHLAELRREEWRNSSTIDRESIINRLKSATKPSPGSLSRFGNKLADFLDLLEKVKTGRKLTGDHVSDIILEERGVVLELVLPTGVYGEEHKQKTIARYERIIADLKTAGYRTVIIEDKSNSLSEARCRRIYEQLLQFFSSNEESLYIIS